MSSELYSRAVADQAATASAIASIKNIAINFCEILIYSKS